jgi:chromosome partitioning protein
MDNKRTRVIGIVNHKGGVGKTTTIVNLSAALAKLGKRVLLMDIDPGAHATYSLGILAHKRERTVYHLLKGQASLEEVLVEIVLERESLDLVPSSLNLAEAEVELSGLPGREFLLREALAHTLPYDFVFIDCPPSLGILTLNALAAASEVFIPLQTEYLALQGLSKLLETVDVVKSRLNPQLEISGVVATRFDKRKILNREVAQKIKEYFKDKFFDVLIRENISLAESPSYGLTIFEYSLHSYGAEDYMSLAKEILEKEKSERYEKTRTSGSFKLG